MMSQTAALVPARCSACSSFFSVSYGEYDNDVLLLDALRARQLQFPLVCEECQ